MRKLVLGLLVVTLLTACEYMVPSDPLSPLALHQEDGEVIVSLGCEREEVEYLVIEQGVSIEDPPGSEITVWRIEAVDLESGSPLENLTIGVLPTGFIETHPYDGTWDGGFISLSVIGGGSSRRFESDDGLDGWRFDALHADEPDGTWEEYQEFVTTAGDDLGGWACE